MKKLKLDPELHKVSATNYSNSIFNLVFNPKCANRNKSRLLFSSAEMFKKPLW